MMEQENEWKTFVRNITWLRNQHGLSKKRMAAVLGIGVKSLTAIEKGEMPPRVSIEIFFRVYDRFDIHPVAQLTERLWEKAEL